MTLKTAIDTAASHGYQASFQGAKLVIWGHGRYASVLMSDDGTFPRRDVLNALRAN